MTGGLEYRCKVTGKWTHTDQRNHLSAHQMLCRQLLKYFEHKEEYGKIVEVSIPAVKQYRLDRREEYKNRLEEEKIRDYWKFYEKNLRKREEEQEMRLQEAKDFKGQYPSEATADKLKIDLVRFVGTEQQSKQIIAKTGERERTITERGS